jgi:histidinol-phosphate/aromatic aminotransferase/cobyric acid decarboxylase-like protein/GNAT superfamily N-acetyltransferase
MRHAVYAAELGQHHERPDGRLTDALDSFNHYIVASVGDSVVGFVSITPPGFGSYSIDKYVSRDALPFAVDDGLFEIRILTVDPAFRGTRTAGLLMYAALRWIEDHGATRVVIIGRSEVASLYERVGMHRLGCTVQSGAVTYELMSATVKEIRDRLPRFATLLRRVADSTRWSLTVPFERRAGAFHGGASHAALGARPTLDRRAEVISADVLDAWFPPAPTVVAAIGEDIAFAAATSPPTDATELRSTIAGTVGVATDAIVVGAGLSDLIFRCLPRWVRPDSRVLLVEPQYSEYRHVLESVVRCVVDTFELDSRDADLGLPSRSALTGYDLVVLVDPNNPLGYSLTPATVIEFAASVPHGTLLWIDRTYAPFAGTDRAIEQMAANSGHVIVGMSMSKAYALSGLRVGYLCGPTNLIDDAWRATPPWAISRPAQAAALAALEEPEYYAARYRDTAVLGDELRADLAQIPGFRPRDGVANFVFCELDGLGAPSVVEGAASRGLYVRSFGSNSRLRWRAVRIAVKDRRTQHRMVEILRAVSDELHRARDAVSASPADDATPAALTERGGQLAAR